jgi:hypothetical protein
MTYRHRTLPYLGKVRNRADGRHARERRALELRDETFELKDFRPRRRWQRHDEEMEKMLKGTSGRHPVMLP